MITEYEVKNKVSIWYFLHLPVSICFTYLFLVKEFKHFSEDPSLRSGWLLFTIIVVIIMGVISQIRYAQTSYLISVEENSISYRKKIGNRIRLAEAVTYVMDYACAYQLNSENKRISLLKKQIPDELDQHLQRKYLENWKLKMVEQGVGS